MVKMIRRDDDETFTGEKSCIPVRKRSQTMLVMRQQNSRMLACPLRHSNQQIHRAAVDYKLIDLKHCDLYCVVDAAPWQCPGNESRPELAGELCVVGNTFGPHAVVCDFD
jgi:hypothetical protein